MSLHALANQMSARGRGPDSTLVHMSPREVHGLQALAMANGGTLTINPQTGLPEAGFLDSLLPALAGFALNAFLPGVGGAIGSSLGLGLSEAAASTVGTGLLVGGATGLATGSLEKGLMAGLGAYGGAGLAGSLSGVPSGMDAASAARDAGISEAAKASPSATLDRLQSGVNTAMSAPVDALKNNAMNIGLASAPLISGAFDNQQASSGLKIHPGHIRGYDKDPVTGTLYQTSATPADQYTGGIKFGGVPEVEGYPKIKGYARGGYAKEFGDDYFSPSSRRLVDMEDDGFNYAQPAYAPPAPVYSAPEPLKGIEALTPAYSAPAYVQPDPVYSAPEVDVPSPLKGSYEPVSSRRVVDRGDDEFNYAQPAYTPPAYSAPAYTPPAYSTQENQEDGVQQSARERRLAELDADRNIDSDRLTPAKGIEALVPPEGEIDAQVVVFGPDGQMYGSPGAARRAGVTNYTMDRPISSIMPEAPPQAPITTPEAPVEDVPDDSQAVDETAKTINFGGVGKLDPVNTSPADSLLSDSQRVQNYLMGKGPNPFNVYHKTQETPVEKAKVATKTLPKPIIKPEQRSGGNPADRAAAMGSTEGGGFPAGLAPAANTVAQALGDMGLNSLSHAISNASMSGAMSGTGAAAGSSTGPDAGVSSNAGWGGRDASGGTANGGYGGPASGATSAGSAPGASASSAAGSASGGEGPGGEGPGGEGPGGRDARGGFLSHGRFDQRYADGGTTGNGSLDLHVPINIGGGGGFGGSNMGGGKGDDFGGGFARDNPGMFGGMSQPNPDFLQQQMGSLPGYQAMQKSQQDFQNSDDYKNFQNYAQEYQQSLRGRQSDAFGGSMGGGRSGFGQQQIQAFANGGIAALANGGMYNLGSYSDGGSLLRGPGDGVSDDIPATIGEKQPARLADGEFVVPARIVSEIGNGSTEAGARKLYAMMDRVQKSRAKTVGKNKVAANTRADKYLPA